METPGVNDYSARLAAMLAAIESLSFKLLHQLTCTFAQNDQL